jgi:hypothetical protein
MDLINEGFTAIIEININIITMIDDYDMRNVFLVNKFLSEIRNNNDLWLQKIKYKNFPFIPNYTEKQLYIKFYNVEPYEMIQCAIDEENFQLLKWIYKEYSELPDNDQVTWIIENNNVATIDMLKWSLIKGAYPNKYCFNKILNMKCEILKLLLQYKNHIPYPDIDILLEKGKTKKIKILIDNSIQFDSDILDQIILSNDTSNARKIKMLNLLTDNELVINITQEEIYDCAIFHKNFEIVNYYMNKNISQ